MNKAPTILFLAVLMVPVGAAFGVSGSIGLQLAGGGNSVVADLNYLPQGFSALVVTRLDTDTDLNGLQYSLQAWRDDGDGVPDSGDTNANWWFCFRSVFSTGKNAGAYGTPSLTHMIDFNNGGLFYNPSDPELFSPADVTQLGYTAGQTFQSASFTSIFRFGQTDVLDEGYVNGTNAYSGGTPRHLLIQHEIGVTDGSVPVGRFFITAGDNGGGFLFCPPGGACEMAQRGSYITVYNIGPEPMSALLLLVGVPLISRRRRV